MPEKKKRSLKKKRDVLVKRTPIKRKTQLKKKKTKKKIEAKKKTQSLKKTNKSMNGEILFMTRADLNEIIIMIVGLSLAVLLMISIS